MNGFALSVGLGAALGLGQVARNAPPKEATLLVKVGVLALAGALFGSRFFFVLTHRVYFANHSTQIVQFWRGGLSWPGAAAGMLVTVLAASAVVKIPVGKLWDGLSPLLLPWIIGVELGCWISGCGYGPIVPEGAFWGFPSPDESGAIFRRFPTPLLSALLLLAGFLAIEFRLKKPAVPGRKAWLGGMAISAILGTLSFLRSEPTQEWYGVKIESWAALVLFVLFAAAWGNTLQQKQAARVQAAMPVKGTNDEN